MFKSFGLKRPALSEGFPNLASVALRTERKRGDEDSYLYLCQATMNPVNIISYSGRFSVSTFSICASRIS